MQMFICLERERIGKNQRKSGNPFSFMTFEAWSTDKQTKQCIHVIRDFTKNFNSISSIAAEKITLPLKCYGLTD